ncbi:MAG: peptide deformylase [Patescibacteria group bacterium]|nr:peptide deformylase [Patescibacteria group bacterium]
MLKIVTAPNSILSQKAREIKNIDKKILKLIEEMRITLNNTRDPEGVGLAAPQVGENLQLFIAKPSRKSPILTFINPKIISIDKIIPDASDEQKINHQKLEGCLSLPNIWGGVSRNPSITLSYLDENGKEHKRKFTGFLATIIQHEYDHLDGILFPKHVLAQRKKLFKSHKNKKNEDVFEEIEI